MLNLSIIYFLFGLGVGLRSIREFEGEERSILDFIAFVFYLVFWPVAMGYEIYDWLLTHDNE